MSKTANKPLPGNNETDAGQKLSREVMFPHDLLAKNEELEIE